MENCTIYSHLIDFDSVEKIIRENLPNAVVKVNDGGKQKQLTATIKGGFFKKNKVLKVNYRERQNPSYNLDVVNCVLSQNLSGMMNFISPFPFENQELKNKFQIKIMSCNTELPFIAEPEFNDDFKNILLQITEKLNAIVFAQPNSVFNKSRSTHFTDKYLNLIIDQKGKSEISDLDVRIDSKYYDQPSISISQDQKDRKDKNEQLLEEKNVQVNKNLPCVEDISEVQIRSKMEISDRIHALMVMAVTGEGLDKDKVEKLIEGKVINGFSPKEKQILSQEDLSEQERAYATWRYESLNTLLWVAGILPDHNYPSEICNVREVVGSIMGKKRVDFDQSLVLKSKEEILDALDLIYRMNWSCVNARVKGEEPSGNLNPSVVYERHYALNWLTNYQDQDWDDVQTDT